MLKNLKKIITVLLLLFWSVTSIYALSLPSTRVMEAFRRYEPDFENSLRKLQELDRRIETLDISEARYNSILFEAEEISDIVTKRYALLEDLLKVGVNDTPADRAELYDGFSKIEDLYKEVRDFHQFNFVERENPFVEQAVATKTTEPLVEEKKELEEAVSKPSRIHTSGVLSFDFRDKSEKYLVQDKAAPFTLEETSTPNDFAQGRFLLKYQRSDTKQFLLENRYLRRKRNELVKENHFVTTYLVGESASRNWALRNYLHHSWYPDNTVKNYRNNLIEVLYNDKWQGRERFSNLGFQTRVYPEYSKSDFRQFNLQNQETWLKRWGNAFVDVKGDWRKYKNVSGMDYDNYNVYTEFNRSYSGNKSELSLSNTFDRRLYDVESVNLYRADYFDNYFRAYYELPIHDALEYGFEGEYQKRNYSSDKPRGYNELHMRALAKFKLENNARAQASYRYVYNDENTRVRAYKNHFMSGMWQKRINNKLRFRLDDTYHLRSGEVGEILDFKENSVSAQLHWFLPSSSSLIWTSEYLSRVYSQLFYRDYRYIQTGLLYSKNVYGKHDWKLEQKWRKFDFRNGNNVSTGWQDYVRPTTSANYNLVMSDNTKLTLRASIEKTFYRTFDGTSQELLWDFSRPMDVKEFFAGLEYKF